ncbi:SixA phosphatase family protein [Jiangella mangrovi]|uniref:Phosphohistidine phosphatase n=1 Tax=Jiangella mangrovi TaxID=1524084 RepID=A0A7W9LPN6_9ACTN|nr:histidine phosphatase family protein [Jiangella mangrovi]MBB5791382.1 phosphohistidine phosphatase [Jiangella mangrovi]
MARTLVLIRHAKAVHPEGRDDHARKLADQGRRDAPVIGRWLRSQDVAVQVAVVSSARRTVETFRLLADELGSGAPDPVVTDDVYYASAGDLLEIVRALPAEAASAAIVGHNPGIGMLAGALDDGESAVEAVRMRAGFPTSSVAVFTVDGDWATVDPGGARLVGYSVARG